MMIKIIVLMLFVFGCRHDVTAPNQVVSKPSPSPSILPLPTPAPSPTAVASPAPSPSFVCSLPQMPDCSQDSHNCCSKGGTNKYDQMIRAAQQELLSNAPELFNADESISISELEYTTRLAQTFENLFHICAVGGISPMSEDEMGIKESNTYATHVDVIIGGSNQPYVGGKYTCSPSAF